MNKALAHSVHQPLDFGWEMPEEVTEKQTDKQQN